MNYLIDTCVLSECVKKSPAAEVSQWFNQQQAEHLFLRIIASKRGGGIGQAVLGSGLITGCPVKAARQLPLHQPPAQRRGNLGRVAQDIAAQTGT